MTHLVIDNSGRSGVTANMIVTEFMATVYHPGTDKGLACYRILVSNHKRADQYGSAVIWAYDDLHKMVNIYLRTVQSQFMAATSQVEQLFISSNGMPLTSSQVANIPEGRDCDRGKNICHNYKEVSCYWYARPHAR